METPRFNKNSARQVVSDRPNRLAGGWRATLVLVSLGLALASACRTGPKRPDIAASLPALKYEVDYSYGPPMSTLTSVDPNSLRAADSLAITVTLIAARHFPVDLLATAESRTSMITVFPADKIVAPVARLTKGTRIGSIDDADQFIVQLTEQESNGSVLLQRFYGVLPPEITASFRFAERRPMDFQSPDGVEIQVCRRSEAPAESREESAGIPSIEMALVASGQIEQETVLSDENSEAEGEAKADAGVDVAGEDLRVTETIFLEPRPFQERDRFVIILPSPFDTTETITFTMVIDVRSPSGEDRAAAAMHMWCFNECMRHLASTDIQDRKLGTDESDSEWPGLENAIRSLRSPLNQRRALLYIAERTNASLTEDIALTGTDMTVGSVSQALTKEYSSGSITSSTSLGWTLERTSYGLLANLLSTDRATPELEAILVRRTGQVGRTASTLEELITKAAGIDEFQRLLVRENFIYLEDISPAARTRALEWLRAEGEAPEGYDPLAPVKERRDVLNRVEKSFDLGKGAIIVEEAKEIQ